MGRKNHRKKERLRAMIESLDPEDPNWASVPARDLKCSDCGRRLGDVQESRKVQHTVYTHDGRFAGAKCAACSVVPAQPDIDDLPGRSVVPAQPDIDDLPGRSVDPLMARRKRRKKKGRRM